MNTPSKQTIIESLGLEAHVEGGYFKRTFQADHRQRIATAEGERFIMTSIFSHTGVGNCTSGNNFAYASHLVANIYAWNTSLRATDSSVSWL